MGNGKRYLRWCAGWSRTRVTGTAENVSPSVGVAVLAIRFHQ